MVGLAGCVYLSAEIRAVGAVLFTFALFMVCEYGLPLYTGRIGYLFEQGIAGVTALAMTLAGNLLGAFMTGIAFRYATDNAAATALCITKLSQTAPQTLIRAFFCGMVMFFCADTFQRSPRAGGKYLALLLGIPVFILPGFEHSIADTVFFGADLGTDGGISLERLWFLVLAVAGNSAGGMVAWLAVPREAPSQAS